ncbi:hypothetical protein GC197_17125 [bacterium]|nr:hypothetical protein [bacterium]
MCRAVAIACLLLLAISLRAQGQVILLDNGGEVHAKASTQSLKGETDEMELEVEGFGKVVLPRERVLEIVRPKVTEDQYFDEAAKYEDTVDDQWKLALWCHHQGLKNPFQRHAWHVLELDPDFNPARKALGYVRHDGRWISQSEIMTQRGYIFFDQDWITRQQAALRVAHDQHEQRIRDWKERLNRWRDQLGRSNAQEIQIDFSTLEDPEAVPGLIKLLGKETDRKLAYLYIETLGRIGSSSARTFLMENAVYQNNLLYRDACLKEVVALRDPRMVEFYSTLLKSYDNNIVNRTAHVLSELDYPTAIFPLAAALETRHLAPHSSRYTYFYTLEKPENRFDIEGPKSTYRRLTLPEFLQLSDNAYDLIRVENRGVHQALIELCDGQDFGNNPDGWKAFYQQVHAPKSPSIRLARDE